jgi:hypothetical protein
VTRPSGRDPGLPPNDDAARRSRRSRRRGSRALRRVPPCRELPGLSGGSRRTANRSVGARRQDHRGRRPRAAALDGSRGGTRVRGRAPGTPKSTCEKLPRCLLVPRPS